VHTIVIGLDPGKLIRQGTHEGLIAAKGKYAKLCTSLSENGSADGVNG